MDKPKDKVYTRYYILLSLLLIFMALDIVLFVFSVYSLLVFMIIFAVLVFMLTITIISLIKYKKRKVQKVDLHGKKIVITDRDLIDMYNKAGIPVIYDEDGKIKNIFELLGISESYDQNGKRILTIYEELGIVPRFTKKGNEVPTVLVIKNKVNGLVKPGKKTGTLKRVLTDEEKEELLLKQMLAQKLEEAEKKGDTKKVNVIKKVIDQKKKESSEKKKSNGFIVLGKTPKPVNIKGGKPGKYKNSFDPKLFVVSGSKSDKSSQSGSKKDKTTGTKSSVGFLLDGDSNKSTQTLNDITPNNSSSTFELKLPTISAEPVANSAPIEKPNVAPQLELPIKNDIVNDTNSNSANLKSELLGLGQDMRSGLDDGMGLYNTSLYSGMDEYGVSGKNGGLDSVLDNSILPKRKNSADSSVYSNLKKDTEESIKTFKSDDFINSEWQ